MNLIRAILGINKFVVVVTADHIENPPDFIHTEPRTYHVKGRAKVNAVEKAAHENYKRNEIVYYHFKTYTEEEYSKLPSNKES